MVAPVELLLDNFNVVVNSFLQPILLQVLALGLQVLPLTLTFWATNDRARDQKGIDNNPLKSETFDFIVVGAGCAGSVVANRLSRNYNVLLLEAGGEINPIQFIPLFSQYLFNYPELDYGYQSVPQRYFDSLMNRQVSVKGGKGLGGSSSVNALIYLRGHTNDYDNWAKLVGDSSWSWNGVLSYFKSYENFEIPGDYVNHGYDGELRIEAPDYIGNTREFVAAAQELGYPNVDLNAPYSEGFDVIRYPIRNGVRQATYKAFIEPVRLRLTLTIRKFAQVNKILMKPGNVAYGVQYDRHGSSYVAYAAKEVIVSAGAIASPKLLMLSGLGPRSELEHWNIPVNVDLPVGQNLKDHATNILGPFYLSQPRSINLNRDVTLSEFVKWATLGRGLLTTTSGETVGLIASSYAKARGEGNWPDIQFTNQCASLSTDGIQAFSHGFNIKLDVATQYFTPAIDRDACLLGIANTRPLSSGYLRLGGNSPYDSVIIQPNYFENDIDWKVIVDGIKVAMILMENTTAFGVNLGATFTDTVLDGCSGLPFKSDAYWECYVKQFSISLSHSSGTVAMGKVVDTKLRVYKTKNLRVIDQSIAPDIVNSNVMASTIMIAEKGADMILKYWQQQREPSSPNPKKGPFYRRSKRRSSSKSWFLNGLD